MTVQERLSVIVQQRKCLEYYSPEMRRIVRDSGKQGEVDNLIKRTTQLLGQPGLANISKTSLRQSYYSGVTFAHALRRRCPDRSVALAVALDLATDRSQEPVEPETMAFTVFGFLLAFNANAGALPSIRLAVEDIDDILRQLGERIDWQLRTAEGTYIELLRWYEQHK